MHCNVWGTVFPRSSAVATIFFSRLKLVVIIQGRYLNEGGDKNLHSIITLYMYVMINLKLSSSSSVGCLYQHPPLLLA